VYPDPGMMPIHRPDNGRQKGRRDSLSGISANKRDGPVLPSGRGRGATVAVLTREMVSAVDRLVAAFHPEEVVLFGSRAYGTAREDSDMDLLLVLRPTDDPQDVRQRRAREALGADGWHRVDGHVWAYTPEELVGELRRGSVVIRDALARGERLFPAGGRSRYAALAREWSVTGAKETLLEKSRDDMAAAQTLFSVAGERGRGWWTVAFHAQQAAEKALKALIYHLGGEPERTHSLSELALRASELDPVRGRALFLKYQPRLAELEKHAVQPRYVDTPTVDEGEARAAIELARSVLAEVTAIVGR
jgi:HEPN domain-containing protein/predicted nucleotidyltransferase